MTKSSQAAKLFDSGFNCAQSVIAVFAEEYGMPQDACLRLATPFGSGIARMQETCGAVTGALMAVGLKYGKGLTDPDANKANSYKLSQEVIAAFKARHKTICCRELLDGLDMSTTEGMTEIQQRELFRCNCSRYVQDAVEIVESILSAEK